VTLLSGIDFLYLRQSEYLLRHPIHHLGTLRLRRGRCGFGAVWCGGCGGFELLPTDILLTVIPDGERLLLLMLGTEDVAEGAGIEGLTPEDGAINLIIL
jgi:hypothetical protein